jgi:hypothetical protein
MRSIKSNSHSSKISSEFNTRLNKLKSHEKVRAIVLLQTEKSQPSQSKNRSSLNRQATIDLIRRTAGAALSDIDEILSRFDGKRLAEQVSALGSIPVETTAEGIRALAESEHVKAILEDQAISSLPKLKQA